MGNTDSFFLLCSSAPAFQGMRLAIVVMLLSLLFTNPPRSRSFRAVLGVFAAVVFTGSLTLMFRYQIGFIDALLFVETAIIVAIAALETPVRISVKSQAARVNA